MAVTVRAVAQQPFDMSAFDVAEIDTGTLIKNTPTRMVFQNGSSLYAITGTSLAVDGSNHATGGTVTQFTVYEGGVVQFVITGLGVNFTDFDAFVQAHDSAGLEAFLLSGDDRLVDSSGNDVLLGFDGADTFLMNAGGTDSVSGGNGDDIAVFNDNFQATDSFNGGIGNDTLTLNGTITAVFAASTIQSVENIKLTEAHDYDLKLNNGNIGTGNTLTVDGSKLGSFDTLTLNATTVSNGTLIATGGDGNDSFRAGAGLEVLNGGGGDDEFRMADHLASTSQLNGGDGYDIVTLNGGYSGGVTFGALTMQNVEEIDLVNGNSYNLTTHDDTVGRLVIFTVDATALNTGDSLTFDGSAETNGFFQIYGGFGDDYIIGGQRGDYIDGGEGTTGHLEGRGGADVLLGCNSMDTILGGKGNDLIQGYEQADTLDGGKGFDLFFYDIGFVTDSTSTAFDTIIGFDTHQDALAVFGFTISVVSAPVDTGTLSLATFDGDLETAIGAGQMDASGAVLFTADAGDQAGKIFLIIDANGTAGYQTAEDFVICLQAPQNIVDFGEFNFS